MSQIAFNDAASISSTKLTVKLTSSNVTKRVRTIPESFEALKQQVKAQMCKGKAEDQFIKSNQYQIVYEDETGDIINVSDDEDLLAAYDVAETSLGRQLKLQIKPRAEAHPELDEKIDQKSECQEQIKQEPTSKKTFQEEDE